MARMSAARAGSRTAQRGITVQGAAEEFARQHPEAAGRLEINSWQRKGKGGWGLTVRTSWYWVAGGKAALGRRTEGGLSNGRCDVCGTVHFEPVLRTFLVDDPARGQETGPLYGDWRPDVQRVYDLMWEVVCPACLPAEGELLASGWLAAVETPVDTLGNEDFRNPARILVKRRHPGAAGMEQYKLDIRDRQKGFLE